MQSICVHETALARSGSETAHNARSGRVCGLQTFYGVGGGVVFRNPRGKPWPLGSICDTIGVTRQVHGRIIWVTTTVVKEMLKKNWVETWTGSSKLMQSIGHYGVGGGLPNNPRESPGSTCDTSVEISV